jgi:hypothetical protein
MQDNTFKFFNDTVNTAKGNLANIVTGLGKNGGIDVDTGLRVAAIQMEMAKATAIMAVAQQLAVIAQNLNGVSTPGQSIRYGMAEVAEAIKNHT